MNNEPEEIKTQFKGPGEWRSQVKRLEEEAEAKEEDSEETS